MPPARRVAVVSAGVKKKNKPQSRTQLFAIADAIHEHNIKLKINTVVSTLNLSEDMLSIYQRLKPNKLKLLYAHKCKGSMENEDEADFSPPVEAYWDFVARNRYDTECLVVTEQPGHMENSYFMIDPQGDVFLNENGTAKRYGCCLDQSLSDIFKTLPFSTEKFFKRYRHLPHFNNAI